MVSGFPGVFPFCLFLLCICFYFVEVVLSSLSTFLFDCDVFGVYLGEIVERKFDTENNNKISAFLPS